MTRILKSSLLCAAAITLMAGSATAGGFAVREQSAEGQGASFAGVAAGTNGLSSMFWNPATMSLHNAQGFVSESNASLIVPYSRAKDGRIGALNPATADSGNIGKFAFVPASYWTYAVNDQLNVGMAMTSPFGLVTDARDTWAGGPNGDKSDVKTYNFNPQVSYKLTDEISLGLGAQVEYMTVNLTARRPGDGFQLLAAKGNDWGFGLTAGVLFQPMDGTQLGLGFRSSVKHKLTGRGILAPNPQGTISAGFDSPETVTLGVRQKVSDQLTLLGGVEWANWSRFKQLSLTVTPPGVTVTTVENWKDSWYYSLGAEYVATDALMLRAGIAYEKSPVPDATRTPRVPDNDRVWLSAGATYKLSDTMTANIAYSHVFVKRGGINLLAPPSPAPLVANFKQHIDIVSAGLTMDW
jgi:long-chain fatty acid transport protein